MRLIITRDQADMKGVFGGHKGVQFTLAYILETTKEEDALIERYRMGGHTVTTRGGAPETVSQLREGLVQTLSTVETLVQNEKVITEACKDFGLLLAVARTFGGEEIVEIPTSWEEIDDEDSEGK
jgi:hypothetical protein